MNINDLPDNLRLLARQRQLEENDIEFLSNTNSLLDAFCWDKTKEGHDFWQDLDDRGNEAQHHKQDDDQILM